ncbi:MAG: caspase family protein [Thermoanaerobaculia bacterium]|nr:caspase family protein [Thermoanaerobaculia bacterium]
MLLPRPFVFLLTALLLPAGSSGTKAEFELPPQDAPSTRGSHPVRRALLVGIDDYESQLPPGHKSAPPGRGFRNLHGAAGDARALSEVLVSRFGFAREHVSVLTDGAATREAILRTFRQQLVEPAGPGDTVVFYFGGHGSQVRNSASDELDRLDESLVPADAGRGAPDIRDKELRKLLNDVLDRGAVPTVVLDSCHSGSGTRGFPTGVGPRAVAVDLRDAKDPGPYGPDPTERGALTLSAARSEELAWETSDEAGVAHGAFSWALLRGLRDALPDEPVTETFQRVRARLHAELRRQEPVLEGSEETLRKPLFGSGSDAVSRQAVVAVERVLGDDTVILQGGWAHGLAVGSRLTWRVKGQEPDRELEVVTMLGLTQSQARRLAAVAAPGVTSVPGRWPLPPSGTLLEISGWAAPLGQVLRVVIPTGDLAIARRLASEMAVRAGSRGIQWVTDPVKESPTHVLRLADGGWDLVALDAPPVRFGAAPSSEEILRRVPSKGRLFLQIPARDDTERSLKIGPGTENDGIEPTSRLNEAAAVLVGRMREGRIEYAWLRPDSTATDSGSELPASTPWRSGDEADTQLRDDLFHLRKIHGWMSLESPPRADFGYRLALVSPTTRSVRAPDTVLRPGEQFELVLEARPHRDRSLLKARYVYVFAIDSAGNSVLLFGLKSDDNPQPYGFRPGQLPATASLGREPLVRITPPYGRDHYVLLTTDEPLPNPQVLQYPGFRSRGPAGATGLEELLSLTGGTTRGAERTVTSTDWSIERWSFVSEE